MLGVGVFMLTWLLPLAFFAWAFVEQFLLRLAGRILVQAQALNHTSFDKGFWMGLFIAVVIALGTIWDWLFDKKKEIRSPLSWGLAAFPLAGALLIGAITWLWQTVLDRPQDDRGYAVAATLLGVCGVFGMLVVAGRLAVAVVGWFWRVGSGEGFVAGAVAIGTLLAGLFAGFVEHAAFPMVSEAIAAQSAGIPNHPPEGFGAGPKAPQLALELMYQALHSDDTPVPSEVRQLPVAQTGPVDDCLNALGADCGNRPCPIDNVKIMLTQRSSLQQADIEDVAHGTLLEVCLKATAIDTAETWRKALFWRAQRRPMGKYRRTASECRLIDRVRAEQDLPVSPEREIDDDALKAALCSLSETDQCVLRAKFYEDLSGADIMRRCGLPSEAMARQQLTRAKDRLRNKLLKLQAAG